MSPEKQDIKEESIWSYIVALWDEARRVQSYNKCRIVGNKITIKPLMIYSVKPFKIDSREIKWTHSCKKWFFASQSSYLKERNWVHLYLCVAAGQDNISSQHRYFIFGRQEEDNQKNTPTYPPQPFPDEDGFNILIRLNILKGPKALPASQTSSRVSSSSHLIYRVCNNRQNVSTYFIYFCRSTGRVPEKNYFYLFMSCIKAGITSTSSRYVSRMIRSI